MEEVTASLSEVNVTKTTAELGKYSLSSDSCNGRPPEKGRFLATPEMEVMRACSECNKHMRKTKDSLICSCKVAFYCSSQCKSSSSHTCGVVEEEKKLSRAVRNCYQIFVRNSKAHRGPSSGKVNNMLKINSKRLLKSAEAGNSTAAYIVGVAYKDRNFDGREGFAIPREYEKKSVAETLEIAVRFLQVAAEGGIPEAMFLLFIILVEDKGLVADHRVARHWLVEAHKTGTMDYLQMILEDQNDNTGTYCYWTMDLGLMCRAVLDGTRVLEGPSAVLLLLATRFRELKAWGGKTAMKEPFYGWSFLRQIIEAVGELDDDYCPSLVNGEHAMLLVISSSSGFSDYMDQVSNNKREENNIKFWQGPKQEVSPDYQLTRQTIKNNGNVFTVKGRSVYLTSCRHNQSDINGLSEQKKIGKEKVQGIELVRKGNLSEQAEKYKYVGECLQCAQDVERRLRAVSLGQFSISIVKMIPDVGYCARFAKEDGVIVQEVFRDYCKPDLRQLMQCLMTNPPDLHPMVLANDPNLFWPIIWYWGSVYKAVEDTCDKITLDAIYSSLGDLKNVSWTVSNCSSLAAFPENAAGEWRIACGSEVCPIVDHEAKFNMCEGCKKRRYCGEKCQRQDWDKHKNFCTPASVVST